MQIILSDHNCEGQAQAIFNALQSLGYNELIPIQMSFFDEVGLSIRASDEEVWQLCQERGYLLLTGNRRAVDGVQSLELTIRRLADGERLPVLTIGNLQRVSFDTSYCRRCAQRLAEIVFDLDNYRGSVRLYLPGSG